MIKAVILDFGGVVSPMCWDPYIISNIMIQVFSKYGIPYPDNFPEIFKEVSNKAFFEMDKTMIEKDLRDIAIKALDEAGVSCDNATLEEALELVRDAKFCEIRAEVRNILIKLREMSLKIGLISNTPDVHPFRALLRENLYDLFDAIILSCWTRYRKPHPKIFEIALSKLGVKPNEAIFVGDMPHIDVLGAKNAGMIAVLMTVGERYWAKMGVAKKRADILADYEISDLSEIIEIVKRING